MANNLSGKISQVLGAVVDIEFDGELPPILQRLQASLGVSFVGTMETQCPLGFGVGCVVHRHFSSSG